MLDTQWSLQLYHISTKSSQITGISTAFSTAFQYSIKANNKALHYWPSVQGKPLWTGGFPSQRASNVQSISMSWCHHVTQFCCLPHGKWGYPQISPSSHIHWQEHSCHHFVQSPQHKRIPQWASHSNHPQGYDPGMMLRTWRYCVNIHCSCHMPLLPN